MDLKQFAEKVIALRTAQKDYLKSHKAIDLLRVNGGPLKECPISANVTTWAHAINSSEWMSSTGIATTAR